MQFQGSEFRLILPLQGLSRCPEVISRRGQTMPVPFVYRYHFTTAIQRGQIGPRHDRGDQILQAASIQAAHGHLATGQDQLGPQVDLVEHPDFPRIILRKFC